MDGLAIFDPKPSFSHKFIFIETNSISVTNISIMAEQCKGGLDGYAGGS